MSSSLYPNEGIMLYNKRFVDAFAEKAIPDSNKEDALFDLLRCHPDLSFRQSGTPVERKRGKSVRNEYCHVPENRDTSSSKHAA
jgi:hypothetical protein